MTSDQRPYNENTGFGAGWAGVAASFASNLEGSCGHYLLSPCFRICEMGTVSTPAYLVENQGARKPLSHQDIFSAGSKPVLQGIELGCLGHNYLLEPLVWQEFRPALLFVPLLPPSPVCQGLPMCPQPSPPEKFPAE